jgi:hypothetical protein
MFRSGTTGHRLSLRDARMRYSTKKGDIPLFRPLEKRNVPFLALDSALSWPSSGP